MPKKLSAATITIIYLVVASLWILLTDIMLEQYVTDPHSLSLLQTYKGWFYVAVTSIGLYLLIKTHDDQLLQKEKKLQESSEKHRSEHELLEKLFDRIPVMINIYNPNIDSFRVNNEFEKITGWKNSELDNVDLTKACFPEPDTRDRVTQFMQSPGTGWREFPMTTKEGKKLDTIWSNIRLYDDTQVGIGMDISKRKRSEEKIRESQQLIRKVFESLESALFIVDPNTRTITDLNKGVENIFGYTQNELIGSSTKILHANEQTYREFDEIGKESLAEQGVFETEFIMKRKNGEIFHTDHTVTLVYDDEGDVEQVVSVIRDITERKEYERELRENKRRLERAQEVGKIGDWEMDPDNNEIYWSPMVYEIYERDPGKGPPKYEEYQEIYHRDSVDKLESFIHEILENSNPCDLDLRIVTGNGVQKFIRAIGQPLKDHSGNILKLVGTFQDITDRKRAQQQLIETKEKYRLTFDHNPQPMWIYDPDTLRFIEVNQAAVEHYGYSAEEFRNMTLEDIRSEKDIEPLKKNITGNIGNHVYGEEWTHYKKDGSEIIVSISAAPLELNGNSYRLVVAKDITRQKQAEQQVLNSVIEGEERERKRVAKELHDGLGQYLSASNMNFEAMKEDVEQLPDKRVQQFFNGLDLLQHAIDETRNIAHNLMPSAIEDYGLELAVRALAEKLQKGADIQINFNYNVSNLELDKQAEINLFRIIQEALNNAINHAECSKISLQIYSYDHIISCMIEDNGIGMQHDAPVNGGGMGIQSMKTRTNALSGTLDINSQAQKGTTILVELPLKPNIKG